VKLELHSLACQTLADQLFDAGVEFPCGGESACGGCKVRVLDGEVPVTATMRQALSEREIRDGWRLACCASAAGRVVVEVEQWSLPVLTDEATVPIEPRAARGAVIDLGTTTLVVQVVDLTSGDVLHVETSLNPQARYGADVMSRLQYDLHHAGELGRSIRRTLGRMLGSEPLREVLVAGNTAMHHLFCGLNVESLTSAPFTSPTLGSYRFGDGELGWPGPAEFLPCLGGFVGSDLLCGIVATGLVRRRSSTSARTERWWWARRGGLCVHRRRPVLRLKAGASARGCERAGERSRACTCATESLTAT
jgi:uncharacterized 2Fe-2S/4Fe-4S cluster protein (DUF4445 family)